MKFNARKASLALPGVTGTARVGTPTAGVLPLLEPGDIAVIDHVDLDRDTATALLQAGVRAVVNAAPMISGRYANLGPEVLAEAGVLLVDNIGPAGLAASTSCSSTAQGCPAWPRWSAGAPWSWWPGPTTPGCGRSAPSSASRRR
jgi:uncharacterized membrane-anchored protein